MIFGVLRRPDPWEKRSGGIEIGYSSITQSPIIFNLFRIVRRMKGGNELGFKWLHSVRKNALFVTPASWRASI
jgi:hypothetical protein